jgi:Arc/MetJ-type ribon-helix-helix transcriptional regulator
MTEKDKKKEPASENKEKKQHRSLDEFGNQMEKFAVKTAESIRKVIDRALASRNTVLTIRVNDESNKKLNMLVEAGLFKSRSESAAFLIEEGIKVQQLLFAKITDKLEKMDKIREELKVIVSKEVEVKPAKSAKSKKKKPTP